MNFINTTFTCVDTANNNLTGTVLSLLGRGKFYTYKVKFTSKLYAMKLFPLNHPLYKKESRFDELEHPKLANPLLCTTVTFNLEDDIQTYSAIITEFCQSGDFFNFFVEKQLECSEKLARTYFHQLVEAVEYMHAVETAHLDIKLENVFLDASYNIKLGDFDLSYMEGDKKLAKGTMNARAPEVLTDDVFDPYKADIFSMGVFLFSLLYGTLPFSENLPHIYENSQIRSRAFWKYMRENVLKLEGDIWSEDFKALFEGMTKKNPKERFGIKEIKESKWFNDEIYEETELPEVIRALLEN